MTNQYWDVIVVGIGSMGSSTLYELAKSGAKVLGLEQYWIVHDQGSHSGKTRIVREAYFEHPDYVPLLKSAYKGWKSIEEESDVELFNKNGLVYFGEPENLVMNGVKESAELYGIELKPYSHSAFPTFSVPESFECFLEPNAGYVLAEKTIKTFSEYAIKHGAEIRTGEKVTGYRQKPDVIEVKTDKSSYCCKKLVLTSGASVNNLVTTAQINQKITNQYLFWVRVDDIESFQPDKFPCWMIVDDNYPGVFYGFPIVDNKYSKFNGFLKIAHHAMGDDITDNLNQKLDSSFEMNKMNRFLEQYIPATKSSIVDVTKCKYTYSEDEHFIIDYLPESNENIIIATGFSGHGFKFVPVVGKIVKELALDGRTSEPIEFIRLDRFMN